MKKTITVILFLTSLSVGIWYWTHYSDEQKKLNHEQSVKNMLAQQESTLFGWIQNIDKGEGAFIIRRKNLMPFMPKREKIVVKNETILLNQDKKMTLDDLKIGQLVKVIYQAGSSLDKTTHVAKSVHLQINKN